MQDELWFEKFRTSEQFALLQRKPLAYFCIEYALSGTLPTYAGGLGVLAGDYIRELADQKIPAVAVGLYYQSRYGLDMQKKRLQNDPFYLHPQEQGLTPVLDKNNTQLLIQIPIQDKTISLKAWKWENGSIPLYLLDTDVNGNRTVDKAIGYKLYDSNKETRFKQEMVLGIGGFRLLEALAIQPSIYHMNEGHSAFLDLEIIRHEMQKRKIGFREAQSLATHHVVFTNHTLVAAGHETYSNDLFTFLLSAYASELEIPVTELVALGTIPDTNSFSMSLFAFRLAGKINAVSKLHAKEAAKVWVDYEIDSVTNGIHVPRWDRLKAQSAKRKVQSKTNNEFSNPLEIWQTHQQNKRELLRFIKEKTGLIWKEDELVIGWARRMVRYKRPMSLFSDSKRLSQIANSKTPLRIIISGIAHQDDTDGREIIQTLKQLIHKELPKTAIYLPDYNVTLAKLLTSGCDVWLNTPVVGSEACGTSGMKACLNGVLPVTTKDGWVDEVDLSQIGWIVDNDTIQSSLLDTIENNVLPLYYAENKQEWLRYMKNSRQLIKTQFTMTRALRDYFEKLYLPIISASYSHYLS